jgi:hypothetical protein
MEDHEFQLRLPQFCDVKVPPDADSIRIILEGDGSASWGLSREGFEWLQRSSRRLHESGVPSITLAEAKDILRAGGFELSCG